MPEEPMLILVLLEAGDGTALHMGPRFSQQDLLQDLRK